MIGIKSEKVIDHSWRNLNGNVYNDLDKIFKSTGVVVENFHKCKEALEKEMREKAKEKRIQRKLKRQQFEESMANRKKKGQSSSSL